MRLLALMVIILGWDSEMLARTMFRMGVFSRLSLLRSPAVFQFFLEASGLFPKQMAFKAKLESWGRGGGVGRNVVVCMPVCEGWRENKRPGSRAIKSEIPHQGRWRKVFLKGKGGVERKKAVLEVRV